MRQVIACNWWNKNTLQFRLIHLNNSLANFEGSLEPIDYVFLIYCMLVNCDILTICKCCYMLKLKVYEIDFTILNTCIYIMLQKLGVYGCHCVNIKLTKTL